MLRKWMTTLVVLVLVLTCAARADNRARFRRHMQAQMQKIKSLREDIRKLQEARQAGDTALAAKLAEEVEKNWSSLPASITRRIEERHPGTGARVQQLVAPARGQGAERAVTYTGTTTREGNTRTTTGSASNGKGDVVRNYSGKSTRDGDTVARQSTVTNQEGEVVRNGVATRTKTGENTWEGERTATFKDGRQVNVQGTATKDGDTLTVDKTRTNAKGNELDYHGTVTRDGDTANRSGTWTNAEGETVRTVEGTATKDGNTITREGAARNAEGDVVRTHHGTSVRDGNTVQHQGTTTWRNRTTRTHNATTTRDGKTRTTTGSASWSRKANEQRSKSEVKRTTRSYRDEYDLFGNGRKGESSVERRSRSEATKRATRNRSGKSRLKD